MKGKTILIMGPTGAGKDTQAQLIVKKNDSCLIRTGDLVRSKMNEDKAIVDQLKSGELVDDDLVNDLVGSFFDRCAATESVISDGFPRRITQAQWFDDYLAESGRKVDLVLVLLVADNLIMKRLMKRQRHDDQQKVIERRLALYHEQTQPVIDYYRQKGVVVEVDGSGDIETVHQRVIAEIEKLDG